MQQQLFAQRRSLGRLPELRAFEILSALPFSRISIAKDVICLLGELDLEDAYQKLLSLVSQELHPDVYIAVIRALWNHLEKPETWEVLQRAAEEPLGTIATKIGQVPAGILTPAEQRKLLQLFKRLLAHPNINVRLALLKQYALLPLHDYEQILTPTLLRLFLSPYQVECELAVEAFRIICTERDIPLLQKAVQTLLENRQQFKRLLEIIPCFYKYSNSGHSGKRSRLKLFRREYRAVLHALLETLSSDPVTMLWRVQIVSESSLINELLPFLLQAVQADELHAEAMMAVCNVLEISNRHAPVENLVAIETALAHHEDERLRLIHRSLPQAKCC